MKTSGFSLVELLVVLAVSSVLVALVGPLGLATVERVKVQSEVVAIQRWHDRMGYTAFIHGQSVEIRSDGRKRLVAYMDSEVIAERAIERLVLADIPVIVFSSAGIPSHQGVSMISDAGRSFYIPLSGALSVRSAY